MTAADHFDQLHRADPDPWNVTTSWYEIRKRSMALAVLPRPRYQRAFEPACSIGAFTDELAPRCAELIASDASAPAVDRARHRVAAHPHVRVTQARIPDDWPTGRFDLIVLAEIGYYLDQPVLGTVIERTVRSLGPRGTLLAVHWRHVADDFRLAGGDAVHAEISAHPGLSLDGGYVDEDVRIELFGAVA